MVEEEIDGELVIQLVEDGRSEHLQRLGLQRLKDELKFRKLFSPIASPSPVGAQSIPTSASCSTSNPGPVDRKLTKQEILLLKPEDKHVYLIK